MYIYEQICKHVFETRTWIDIYIHVYKDRDVDIYEKCFYVHTYMYIKIGNGGVIQGMGDVDTYIPIRVDIQEMGNPFPVCHVIHINVYTCICLYVYMYVSTSPFPHTGNGFPVCHTGNGFPVCRVDIQGIPIPCPI